MIVRLMPEQVGGFWDLVKTGIVQIGNRLTPGNWDMANNVFTQCLAGVMQVWLCSAEAEQEGEQPVFIGFFMTAIEVDKIDKSRNLQITYAYAMKPVTDDLLREAVNLTNQYAKENNCTTITFVSLNAKTEALAERAWPGKLKKLTHFSIKVGEL